MVSVVLFSESRYLVNRKSIKKTIESVLGERGISQDSEVSVSIVGDRKMKALNKKYRQQDKTTDVLSFSLQESGGIQLPDKILQLGDIVISYPQAVKNAARKESLVDDEINFLVSHALHHLLGIHHE